MSKLNFLVENAISFLNSAVSEFNEAQCFSDDPYVLGKLKAFEDKTRKLVEEIDTVLIKKNSKLKLTKHGVCSVILSRIEGAVNLHPKIFFNSKKRIVALVSYELGNSFILCDEALIIAHDVLKQYGFDKVVPTVQISDERFHVDGEGWFEFK